MRPYLVSFLLRKIDMDNHNQDPSVVAVQTHASQNLVLNLTEGCLKVSNNLSLKPSDLKQIT